MTMDRRRFRHGASSGAGDAGRRTVLGAFAAALLVGPAVSGSQPVSATGPAVAALQNGMRERFLRHAFWVRETNRALAERREPAFEVARERTRQVAAELAQLLVPYFGRSDSDRWAELLLAYSDALAQYTRSLVKGGSQVPPRVHPEVLQQVERLAGFTADHVPTLRQESVKGVFGAIAGYQTAQAQQLVNQRFREEADTLDVLRQNLNALADAMVIGLAERFPERFSANAPWQEG